MLKVNVTFIFTRENEPKPPTQKEEMGGESPLTIRHFDGFRYAVKMTILQRRFAAFGAGQNMVGSSCAETSPEKLIPNHTKPLANINKNSSYSARADYTYGFAV